MVCVEEYVMMLIAAAVRVLFQLGEYVGHDLIAYGVIHAGVQGIGFVGARVVLPMVSAVVFCCFGSVCGKMIWPRVSQSSAFDNTQMKRDAERSTTQEMYPVAP